VLSFQTDSDLDIGPITYGLVIHHSLFEIVSARACFHKAEGCPLCRPLQSKSRLFSPESENSGVQGFEQSPSVGKLTFDR
jgi:hypothetical protein